MKYPITENIIGGKPILSNGDLLDVVCPLDGEVISQVHLSGWAAVDEAVKTANNAFEAWSGITLKERVQVFFKYKQLLEENMAELSALIHEENGKTIGEAKAEIEKAVELLKSDKRFNEGSTFISALLDEPNKSIVSDYKDNISNKTKEYF